MSSRIYRVVIRAVLLGAVAAVAGCGGLRNGGQPSTEMAGILREREVNQYQVSTAGLLQLTGADSMARASDLAHANGLEVYAVRPTPGAEDAFGYTIYLDHQTGEYWIVRTGGVAGGTAVFGPGKMEAK